MIEIIQPFNLYKYIHTKVDFLADFDHFFFNCMKYENIYL